MNHSGALQISMSQFGFCQVDLAKVFAVTKLSQIESEGSVTPLSDVILDGDKWKMMPCFSHKEGENVCTCTIGLTWMRFS